MAPNAGRSLIKQKALNEPLLHTLEKGWPML
jgi:hypothetical protein